MTPVVAGVPLEGLDRVGLAALGASVVHEAVLVAQSIIGTKSFAK